VGIRLTAASTTPLQGDPDEDGHLQHRGLDPDATDDLFNPADVKLPVLAAACAVSVPA